MLSAFYFTCAIGVLLGSRHWNASTKSFAVNVRDRRLLYNRIIGVSRLRSYTIFNESWQRISNLWIVRMPAMYAARRIAELRAHAGNLPLVVLIFLVFVVYFSGGFCVFLYSP